MESDIKLDVCFRFLDLTQEKSDELKVLNLGSKFGVHFKTKKITGLVPLNESCIPKIQSFIKSNDIPISDTDIYISFITDYDSRIIDIPEYVNEAVSKIGSKMVLSYTIE